MHSLKENIYEWAIELGFSQIGITPAVEPKSAVFYREWVSNGNAGKMSYMEKDPIKRSNPLVYWEEARSIVVLSMSYQHSFTDMDQENADETNNIYGHIALYACFEDYHDIIKKRLHLLGQKIQRENPQIKYIPVVDTSAVLERAHAQNAGLGWFGKNAMIINQKYGSYTLLSCLLLNIDLPSDKPSSSHCGSCNKCITSCPTNAITSEHVIDARKCISYLTIELKGEIPDNYKKYINKWLFGCDICQEVCPWVKYSYKNTRNSIKTPLHDTAISPKIPLNVFIGISKEHFRTKWKNRPLLRSKLEGILRNTSLILGNSEKKDVALRLLETLSSNENSIVRQHTAWALGNQNNFKSKKILARMKSIETEPKVIESIDSELKRE